MYIEGTSIVRPASARSGAEYSALVVQRYQFSPPWKPLA